MNLIYFCVFNQEDKINILKLLIETLDKRGNINNGTTDILIITSPIFQPIIQNELSCFNLKFQYYVLDLKTRIETSCAKLHIFDYHDINNYDKILYLDTDILINSDINVLFNTEITDKLYVLEEGCIGNEIWGSQFFDFSKYSSDLPAFSTEIFFFRNTKTIKDLFDITKSHIIDYINKNNAYTPMWLDKPFVVYNAIISNNYDNIVLKKYVIKNPEEVSFETVIFYDFNGFNYDYLNKYSKMKNFMSKMNYFCDLKNDITFITLTSSGYTSYTLNCLKSLQNIKSDLQLHCYCIGKTGYNNLLDRGYDNSTLINDEENSNFTEHRQRNWASIMLNKMKIIHENLLKYKFVCYTDSDIVYEDNQFLDYLLENIDNYEMLIQSNNTVYTDASTGFMFIKSNPNTINLFNPSNIKLSNEYDFTDYVNSIRKNNIKHKLLPISLFPYGGYYYENHLNIKPYLIHFSWVTGHDKRKKMLSHNKWFNKIKICQRGIDSFSHQLEGIIRLISHSLNNKVEYQYNYRKSFTFEHSNFDKSNLEDYLFNSFKLLSNNSENSTKLREFNDENISYNNIINSVDNYDENIYFYDGVLLNGSILPPNFEGNDELIQSLPAIRNAFVENNLILPAPSYDTTKKNICCHVRLCDAIGRKIPDDENLCNIIKYFQKNSSNRIFIYSNDNIEHLKSENTVLGDSNTDVLQILSDFIHADILVINYSSLSIAAHLLAKESQQVICPNKAGPTFYSRILNKCIKIQDFCAIYIQNKKYTIGKNKTINFLEKCQVNVCGSYGNYNQIDYKKFKVYLNNQEYIYLFNDNYTEFTSTSLSNGEITKGKLFLGNQLEDLLEEYSENQLKNETLSLSENIVNDELKNDLHYDKVKGVAFITLTSSGYISYTLNCLKSLQNIKSDLQLHCYCIGKTGYNNLLDRGYDNSTLINDEENSNFTEHRQRNWASIMLNKMKIIHENLLKYKFVCYTDSDIVYEDNQFLDYLLENIDNYEMLIQSNNTVYTDASTGFMFIKSNPNTINLFNPSNIKLSNEYDFTDYVNSIRKNNIKHKLLPISLFPYGGYYYENHLNIKPYLIHFSWVTGHDKRKKMLSHNKWFNKIKICQRGIDSFSHQLEGIIRLISHSLNNKVEYQYNYRKSFTFEHSNFDKSNLEDYLFNSFKLLSNNSENSTKLREFNDENISYNNIINSVDNYDENIYFYDGVLLNGSILPPNFEGNDELIQSLPAIRNAFVENNLILPAPSYDTTKKNICCHVRLCDAIGRKIPDDENLCNIIKYFQKNSSNRIFIYSNDNIEHLKSENTVLGDSNTDVLQILSDFIHADILITNYASLPISAHLLAKESQQVICPSNAGIGYYSRMLNKCIKSNDFAKQFIKN